ncbi:MAG: thiamine diphosphokinase [Oscillospiraceae bacterium]|nr:thiamine diphosphokinase [Oscillospiraceae bacterium]
METKRCVILCAGATAPEDIAWAKIGAGDFVIAADAGYLHAQTYGIRPNLIVGDFDSSADPGALDIPIERFPTHKDDTDCMLAVRRGLAEGCRSFVILGGLGGRLDHTLANLQTLAFLADHGATGWLKGEGAAVTLLRKDTITLPRPSGYLSLFALGGPCRGITLQGTEYPLENAELTPGFPLGVSNHIVEETADVTVTEGDLLIVLTDN